MAPRQDPVLVPPPLPRLGSTIVLDWYQSESPPTLQVDSVVEEMVEEESNHVLKSTSQSKFFEMERFCRSMLATWKSLLIRLKSRALAKTRMYISSFCIRKSNHVHPV